MNSIDAAPEPESAAREEPEQAFVDYDGVPVLEVSLDEVDYRLDAGRQGTALCISTRPSGTWAWSFAGEARWNGSELRSRGFDRPLLERLSTALVTAIAELG